MSEGGKLFRIEVLGIFETRANSFDEAYAKLERALDNEDPIVLKHAFTSNLKVGDDGKPYPYMQAVVRAFTRLEIERLSQQGHDHRKIGELMEADDYTEGE